MSKFKVGDFVDTDTYPNHNEFIVTRVYDDGFIAVCDWDIFIWIPDETKVMEKFFVLSPQNNDEEHASLRDIFIKVGYFFLDEDGNVCFDHTESTTKDSEDGINFGFMEGTALITGIE